MSYLIRIPTGEFIDPTNQPLSNKGVAMATVTPAMARHWLTQFNVDNRNMRQAQVHYLANLIETSQYHQDASVVAFSYTRELLNGQHTLKAISDTDTEQSLTIQYGMPPEAYAAYDTGIPRSLNDITNIDASIIAIINVMYYACLRTNSPKKMTPAKLQSLLETFKDSISEITSICNWKKSLTPAVIPAAFVASYYLDPNHRDWHRTILKWLSHDFDITQTLMPRIIHSWNVAINTTIDLRAGGVRSREQNFLKCMRVFDAQSKNHIKILSMPLDSFRDRLRQICEM